MAGLNDGVRQLTIRLDSPNRLIQTIPFTTAAARTTYARVTADDNAFPVLPGDLLGITGSVDFWFELRRNPATAGATTTFAGARPGTKVFAGQYWFFSPGLLDTVIEILGDAASGTAALYLLKRANP